MSRQKRAIALVASVALAILVAAGALGVRGRCAEARGPLPAAELAAEQYRLIDTPGRLPWAVQQEIARRLRQSSLHMAAVGQPFNATDVVMDESLPWSRLTAAAVGSCHAIVQFETGGFGYMRRTLVFRQDGWSGWV